LLQGKWLIKELFQFVSPRCNCGLQSLIFH
jgi:hypothetical protein